MITMNGITFTDSDFQLLYCSDPVQAWIFSSHIFTTAVVGFITAKMAFIFTSPSAVHLYDFHIFTVIYSSLQGIFWNQHNEQLPVGLLAQFKHCTNSREIIGSNPTQAWIFFRPYLHYYPRSIHCCKDHFHIQQKVVV